MTAERAREKVAECTDMADHSRVIAHQIMLRHMAETWERIAKDIEHLRDH